MTSVVSRLLAAVSAFREPNVISKLMDETDFTNVDARRMRYALYWAFYENTAYRKVHSWAGSYKTAYGLYKWTRGVYNPSYRLGEFWKSHLFGGSLDPDAGDGKSVPSAIPIEVPKANQANDKRIREALAALWKSSGMQTKKDLMTLWGSVLGDVVIRVNDDPIKEEVSLSVVHPAHLSYVELDAQGNVKEYFYEEERIDPERPEGDQKVTYGEKAENEDGVVTYQTFRNGRPFAWDEEQGEEWTEMYGFVPMVLVKHNDVGMDWGWSELHAIRTKFHEADDLASKLSDHVRKHVDPAWLFSGVKSSDVTKVQKETPTQDRPEPGRDDIPVLYGPVGAQATPLVSNLSIADVVTHLREILKEIERDHPELQMDIWSVQGDVSGRALRTARQRAETKVNERRPNYEDALVRAQMMAMTIGGMNGYDGYAGFGEGSYEAGGLLHRVGKRPVFSVDPLDDIEVDKAFWDAAKVAVDTGVPLPLYLRKKGWSEEDIAEITDDEERKAKLEMMKAAAALAMGNQTEGETGKPKTPEEQAAEDQEAEAEAEGEEPAE